MVERFDYHHTMSESLGRYPEGQFVYYSDYAKLAEALRNIAEGNLGDEPWQANYSRIRQVARAALSNTAQAQRSEPAACSNQQRELPAEGKGESEARCTCVYATAKNTPAVRSGHELGGYVKEECPSCKARRLASAIPPAPQLLEGHTHLVDPDTGQDTFSLTKINKMLKGNHK